MEARGFCIINTVPCKDCKNFLGHYHGQGNLMVVENLIDCLLVIPQKYLSKRYR